MSAMSNADFADAVRRIAGTPPAFEPRVTYDEDGDCIEFIAKPDAFYAERIDDLVTVYYSQETDEIVGSLVKGISKFLPQILKTFPGFGITIAAGRVRLNHIFLAKVWASAPAGRIPRLTYKKLIEMAEEVGAEAEMSVA